MWASFVLFFLGAGLCLKAYQMPKNYTLVVILIGFYNSGKIPQLQRFCLCHNNSEVNSRNTLVTLESKLPGLHMMNSVHVCDKPLQRLNGRRQNVCHIQLFDLAIQRCFADTCIITSAATLDWLPLN